MKTTQSHSLAKLSKHQRCTSPAALAIRMNSEIIGCSSGDVPYQVMTRLGNGILFRLRLEREEGCWDVKRIIADLSRALLCCDNYGNNERIWHTNLVFGTRQGTFIHYKSGSLYLYASSMSKIEIIVRRLSRYWVKDEKAKPEFGTYHLLRLDNGSILTHPVRMKPAFQMNQDAMGLHYGSDFIDWHRRFHEGLLAKDHGLTIFDGPPGTGKTSYLRHLMVELRETHRFYFVPPASVGIVSNPSFVDFWNREREDAGNMRFVMVLEDAEQALMSRGGDNRNEVSSILNITDGLLADFLQIQLICTINCGTDDIDPALLRPGRLFAKRTFGRLSYGAARRLAATLGKEIPLQSDFSLAEIFAVEPIGESERNVPRIGFAA